MSVAALLLAACGVGSAYAGADPVEARAASAAPAATGEAGAASVEPKGEIPGGFTALGLLDARVSVTNLATTNPLVNGQVVGTLGGTNATTLQDGAGAYTEERGTAILSWRPKALGGHAALTAGFEVDFAWGDQSYSIGGNTGGGFGGDQVNLQTRRLHGSLDLWKGARAVVGLQFVADGSADPERSRLDDLARGGGRLLFFGSEAAGVTVYGTAFDKAARFKVGGYTLAEQALAEPDDITLWMADGQYRPAYATTIGAHFWYLRDRAGGTAGAFGSGPTSALSTLQGGPALDLSGEDTVQPETSAALAWAGLDAGYNAALDKGPLGATALVVVNFGRLYVTDEKDVNVLGALADVEARYRYAPGGGSVVRVEGLFTTGDPDAAGGGDPGDTYSGIVTANSYGVAAAQNVTTGCLLLFQDPLSINRQVAVVYDASAQGAGLAAVTAQVGYDPIPNRLTVALGGGHAEALAGPGPSGTELNLRVVGRPLPLTNLGVYGGMVLEPQTDAQLRPWMVYTALNQVFF